MLKKKAPFCLTLSLDPRLPLEVWSESACEKILRSIGKIYNNSEVIFKGLFARVCLAVDISKPLKREIKYKRDGALHSCLLDNRDSTDICYGCGSQNHKFDTNVFNSKNISIRIENVQVVSQVADNMAPQLVCKPRPKTRFGVRLDLPASNISTRKDRNA